MLIGLRRPKITCSSSYVDYRPKTKSVVLLDTKGSPHMGGIGEGKETKNLNVFDVLTV
jgi:hypothetical protein